MTDRAFRAALKAAIEVGWLEECIPFWAGDRFLFTLTDDQLADVIQAAEDRLATEFDHRQAAA